MIYEGTSAVLLAQVMKYRSRLVGVIVARKESDKWTRYWDGDGCSCFSEYESEAPKVFRSISAAYKRRDILNDETKRFADSFGTPITGDWHVVLWQHPEYFYQPIKALAGALRQLPGCPTH